MAPIYLEKARKDLYKMDKSLARIFIRHVNKISGMPPRRHMEHGLPYNVDEVGGGRLVYDYRGEQMYIVRCFDDHKKYEKWFNASKRKTKVN